MTTSTSTASKGAGGAVGTGAGAPYKIMVLVDGSTHSDAAFDAAVALKKPEHVLQLVHSVNLVRPWTAGPHAGPYLDPQTLSKTNDALIHNAKHLLHRYTRWAQQLRVPVQAFAITSDENPKDAALHFAREQKVALIVVGSRGLGGIQRLLVGSFSTHVVQNAQCDVLVARIGMHKTRDTAKDVGTATRAELQKIVTAEQHADIGSIQPHAGPSPLTAHAAEEGMAQRHSRLRKQLEAKQNEMRALLDELGSDENQREAALRVAMSENAEMSKRREMEAARSNQQLQDLRKARDDLLEQIKQKEAETEKLRGEHERALQALKQKQTETDQRTREKEEAVAQVRKRVEAAETERLQFAGMLKRTEEIAAKERQKRDNELAQLRSQAQTLQSESEHEKAAREKAVRDKEAEIANERKKHEAQRAEFEKEIDARGKQIANEQKREQQLEKEIEAQRQHAADLTAETKSLHDEMDKLKSAHHTDVDRLTRESSAKLDAIRAELHADLNREQQRLQDVIKAKDAELAAERAKRKETELLRAQDEETRIGEKAQASRLLREEMERTEAEAQQRLKEQRERAHQMAQEMRQAESEAARSVPLRDPSGRHHAATHSHVPVTAHYTAQVASTQTVLSARETRTQVHSDTSAHGSTHDEPAAARAGADEEVSGDTGFVPEPNKKCVIM